VKKRKEKSERRKEKKKRKLEIVFDLFEKQQYDFFSRGFFLHFYILESNSTKVSVEQIG